MGEGVRLLVESAQLLVCRECAVLFAMENTTVYQCNSTYYVCLSVRQEELCAVWAWTFGAVNTLLSVISFALLLSVLVGLRRKACSSPVKRLCILLSSAIGLIQLLYASVGFYNGFLPQGWCLFVASLSFILNAAIFYYVVVLLLVFLLKIGAPFIRRLKRRRLRKKLICVEVAVHIAIPVLSLLTFIGIERIQDSCNNHTCSGGIAFSTFAPEAVYVVLGCLVLGLLVFIAVLAYFHIRFMKARGTRVNWPLSSVLALFLLIVTEVILHIAIYVTDGTTQVVLQELVVVLEVLCLAVLFALTYLRGRRCKMCWCRKRAEQAPLVGRPNAPSYTNPPSEWDHANDPSTTIFVPPPEMSDCISDTSI